MEEVLRVGLLDVELQIQFGFLPEPAAFVNLQGDAFLGLLGGEFDAGHLAVEVFQELGKQLLVACPQHQDII